MRFLFILLFILLFSEKIIQKLAKRKFSDGSVFKNLGLDRMKPLPAKFGNDNIGIYLVILRPHDIHSVKRGLRGSATIDMGGEDESRLLLLASGLLVLNIDFLGAGDCSSESERCQQDVGTLSHSLVLH